MICIPISPPPIPRRPEHVAVWFGAIDIPGRLAELVQAQGVRVARASNSAELTRVLESGDDVDIIVPFARMADFEPFAQTAERVLIPEDRDVGIIYATTGSTPEDWAMPPDPRPFGNAHRRVAEFGSAAWNETADTLRVWGREARLNAGVGRKSVRVTPAAGMSLEEWQIRLLRASFRGCREVGVAPVAQGYSGSLLMRVHAIDGDGSELPAYMAKAFPDSNAALEIAHFQSSMRHKLDERDFSEPESLRLVAGEGRSMLVSRMVAGPGGQIVTLRGLFDSHPSSVLPLLDRLASNLKRVFQGAQQCDYSIAKAYLANLSTEQVIALNGELQLMRWAEVSDAPDPIKAFLEWLDRTAGKATRNGIVHGDLHGDNIVIWEDGQLKPVLIDFAHTEQAHAVADLAALAADVLVRVVPNSKEQNKQIESIRVLFGLAPPSSVPDRAIVRLHELAQERLSCGIKEFAGAMLCRILWIIPRARDPLDRESLRAAADGIYRNLAGA